MSFVCASVRPRIFDFLHYVGKTLSADPDSALPPSNADDTPAARIPSTVFDFRARISSRILQRAMLCSQMPRPDKATQKGQIEKGADYSL